MSPHEIHTSSDSSSTNDVHKVRGISLPYPMLSVVPAAPAITTKSEKPIHSARKVGRRAPPSPMKVRKSPRGISDLPVLIAVTDPHLYPEVLNIVATTGREIIEIDDARDIARYSARVSAVLIDADSAVALVDMHVQIPIFLLFTESQPIDWKLAVEIGVEDICVLPAQAAELLACLGRGQEESAEENYIITVMGAAGGAGTSTLAAILAQSVENTVLIDADPYSGGLDLLLGIEESLGVRWSDISFSVGHIEAKDLLASLPQAKNGLKVLTSSRTGLFRVEEQHLRFVIDCLRGYAAIVIDISGTSSELMLRAATDAASLVVLVIPAEVRPVAAAAMIVDDLHDRHVRVAGVIRNRAWSGMDLNDIERVAGVDVVAAITTTSRLHKHSEMTGLDYPPPRNLQVAASKIYSRLSGVSP